MTLKEVTIGDARLILGDARSLIASANMICCDAPYLLTSGGKNDELGGKLSSQEYENGGDIVECDITWQEIWGVFSNCLTGSEQAHIYCMSNNRNIKDAWLAAEENGFHFHNILPWNKVRSTPNRWYMKNLEFTLMFKKGNAFAINDCGQDQLIKFPLNAQTEHPTEKPVELMANYIRQSTKPGELVCDPFMGSGSTAVAAIREGRKFVGCELVEQWFDVTCDRVRAEYEKSEKRLAV